MQRVRKIIKISKNSTLWISRIFSISSRVRELRSSQDTALSIDSVKSIEITR